MMMNKRDRDIEKLTLGINVSILVILMIFAVLLSLPLRLLFDTKYYDRKAGDERNVTDPEGEKEPVIPVDHRKLRRCPNMRYEHRLTSVFSNDYDGNCTYARDKRDDEVDGDNNGSGSSGEGREKEGSGKKNGKLRSSKRGVNGAVKENAEEISKTRQIKSVTVAGHILVVMLLVSVIAALVEVLRIRFAREKDSSRAGTTTSRRCSSSVEMPVAKGLISRESIKSQGSIEVQEMHRSALHLLGARPPPLIRRSSFPTQQAKQAATSSFCATPNRRQSAESEEEIGAVINALHHRTRLIRRH